MNRSPGPDNIAIVIPAYNESATIVDVVKRARAQSARVIVVDDGSVDGTADLLAGLDVTVLRNAENSGKGASIFNGVQHALAEGAEAVITLDGDGQHQPEDIPRVLTAARIYPGSIIVASRLRKTENAPPLRLFANRFANFWVSWAAGYWVPDSQSGFRLYPRAAFEAVQVPHTRERSFVFESEILIEAAWQGIKSEPVPIDSVYFEAARHSHYKPTEDTMRIVRMIAGRLLRKGMNPLGLYRVLRFLMNRTGSRVIA